MRRRLLCTWMVYLCGALSQQAAASVGHGFLRGWSLAILGDMGYFFVLMGSTLWLSSTLGNDRLTMLFGLGMALVLPLLLQRVRGRLMRPAATTPALPD